MSRVLPLSLLLSAVLAAPAAHAAPPPITIEQAMAGPDWIGPPVEKAWWSWNSQQVEYQLKRNGSPVRDTFRQPLAGGAAAQVADDQRGTRTWPSRSTTAAAAAAPSSATAMCSCATCAAAR